MRILYSIENEINLVLILFMQTLFTVHKKFKGLHVTKRRLPASKKDVKNDEGHEQTQNISIGVVLSTPQDKKKVSVKETVPYHSSNQFRKCMTVMWCG